MAIKGFLSLHFSKLQQYYRVEHPRKDDMIPFPFNENWFSFFGADHQLVGQLCTNPESDRSLLSCLKVTQCSTSKIGDVLLYNSCSLPIQVMTTGPLSAPSKCKSGLPRITGTCPGWWKQSFRLWLWSLVWFQVRATSSKSAWKSTPKCTWMCWRVWWSPGAISLVIHWEHHQHDLPQHQSQPDRRHPLSIRRASAGTYGKGMLPVPSPYRGGDWGWRRLHWIDVSSTI